MDRCVRYLPGPNIERARRWRLGPKPIDCIFMCRKLPVGDFKRPDKPRPPNPALPPLRAVDSANGASAQTNTSFRCRKSCVRPKRSLSNSGTRAEGSGMIGFTPLTGNRSIRQSRFCGKIHLMEAIPMSRRFYPEEFRPGRVDPRGCSQPMGFF